MHADSLLNRGDIVAIKVKNFIFYYKLYVNILSLSYAHTID